MARTKGMGKLKGFAIPQGNQTLEPQKFTAHMETDQRHGCTSHMEPIVVNEEVEESVKEGITKAPAGKKEEERKVLEEDLKRDKSLRNK